MVNREQETDFDEINPLGPVEAYFTNDYFDRCFNRDNLLYRTLKRNPTTIIGRRGSLPNTGGLELRRFGENRATALGETFQSVCDVNAENYICRNTESFGKCPFEIR